MNQSKRDGIYACMLVFFICAPTIAVVVITYNGTLNSGHYEFENKSYMQASGDFNTVVLESFRRDFWGEETAGYVMASLTEEGQDAVFVDSFSLKNGITLHYSLYVATDVNQTKSEIYVVFGVPTAFIMLNVTVLINLYGMNVYHSDAEFAFGNAFICGLCVMVVTVAITYCILEGNNE